MGQEAEIVALLRKLCNINTDFSFIAEVTENYPNEQYVDVKATDGTVYPKVRKRSGIDGKKGILATPVKGSTVIVSRLHDSDDLFIAVFGEIESYKIELFDKTLHLEERKVLMQSGDFAVKIDEDGVTLNDGSYGGLIKIGTLKTELDKNNQILTAILGILNGAPIPEAGNGAASALQAALKTALTGKTVGVFTNIENDKVKH